MTTDRTRLREDELIAGLPEVFAAVDGTTVDRERAEVRAQIERMPGGPGPERWIRIGSNRQDSPLYIEDAYVALLAARQQLLDRGCVDHPDIDGLVLCP